MPLINTQSELKLVPPAQTPSQEKIDSAVSDLLKSAGINPAADLATKLAENNLSTEDCIAQLSDIVRNGENRDGVRLRAVETGLKLNRVLDNEKTGPTTNFTIVINDPRGAVGINPILIPR